MGFVDTESESSSLLPTSTEDEGDNDLYDDEESAMGKESPYINTLNQDRARPQSNDLRTPTTKNNDFLNVTRLRRKAVTESQEIWEELEDASPLALPPSPWSRRDTRSSSLRSTPSRPPTQRHGSAPVADEGEADDEMADEETALLGRSGTGRTYRDRRRRVSAPTLGREGGGGKDEAQGATGGWWRMGWWGGDGGKGKGGRGGGDEGRGDEGV